MLLFGMDLIQVIVSCDFFPASMGGYKLWRMGRTNGYAMTLRLLATVLYMNATLTAGFWFLSKYHTVSMRVFDPGWQWMALGLVVARSCALWSLYIHLTREATKFRKSPQTPMQTS